MKKYFFLTLERIDDIKVSSIYIVLLTNSILKVIRHIWFTGLSDSVESTLANLVEFTSHEKGLPTYILDGDTIRQEIART